MNILTLALGAVVLVIALATQWYAITARWKGTLSDLQAKHSRHKKESAELLASTRQQIADLKHQLEGARLAVKRTERQPRMPLANSAEHNSEVTESILLMLDEGDRHHESQGVAPHGFADTTIRFRGSNSDYSREKFG